MPEERQWPNSPFTDEEVKARIAASVEVGILDFKTRGGFSEENAFYLSFVDARRPEGTQWIGGCYIPGDSVEEVSVLSHVLKINPGGSVQYAGPFPLNILRPEYVMKLLNREEINLAVDEEKAAEIAEEELNLGEDEVDEESVGEESTTEEASRPLPGWWERPKGD